jgi:hypothetical protein
MKVGDMVRWGNDKSYNDLGLVVAIGSGDGAGLAYVEWSLVPTHSGYLPIEEEMLEVINEGR